MNNQVVDTLKNAPLFTRCGQVDSLPVAFPYEFLTSVQKVNESLLAPDWENFTLEARNRLTTYLSKRKPREYNSWNEVTERYKRDLTTFDALVQELIGRQHIDPVFKHDFDWIVLAMCMEGHYYQVDAHLPVLFQQLLPVYEMGHIPCGWRGQITEDHTGKSMQLSSGTLLVY